MAEAFLRDLAGDELEIVSAGGEPGRLDPDAVTAMREAGIDISSAQAKVVDPYLRERFHYVITLCDRAKERSAPYFQAQSGGRIGRLKARPRWKRQASNATWRCATRATRSAGTSLNS